MTIGADLTGKLDAGTYTITLSKTDKSLAKNYDIKLVNGTLTVEKVDLTITADSLTKKYGEILNFTYTNSGLVNGDTLDDVCAVTIGADLTGKVDAGTHTITLSKTDKNLAKNYNITLVNGTLTVEKKDISLVWSTENEFEYDGNTKSISVTGITGLDDFTTEEINEIINSISYTGNGESEVGNYDVTATLNNNNFNVSNSSSSYKITEVVGD